MSGKPTDQRDGATFGHPGGPRSVPRATPGLHTAHRRALLAGIGVLAVLAMVFGLRAFALLAAVWTVYLLVAPFTSHIGLHDLHARRRVRRTAFEGDTVDVAIDLENRSRWRVGRLELWDLFRPTIPSGQAIEEPAPMRPGRVRRVPYRATCVRQWGIYELGPLTVVRSDPMGLFHAQRRLPVVDRFAVLPGVHDVAAMAPPGAAATWAPEEASMGRPGQSPLYLGTRDYRPGDEPRRIHWPATAHRGTPIVKQYETDLIPYFTVFLDLEESHRAGLRRKSTGELLVRSAASFLSAAGRRGHMVQMLAHGARSRIVPPGRGEAHLMSALHQLIQVRQDGSLPVSEAVKRHAADLPTGSRALLLWSTATPPRDQVAEVVDAMRSRRVDLQILFIDHHSFASVDRWPVHRSHALQQRALVTRYLRDRRVPFAVVDAQTDLGEALGSPRLFG